jgi:hypothetical protein
MPNPFYQLKQVKEIRARNRKRIEKQAQNILGNYIKRSDNKRPHKQPSAIEDVETLIEIILSNKL